MAEQPTPYSIALSALIVLHQEFDSPLYEWEEDRVRRSDVDAFLQRQLLQPQQPQHQRFKSSSSSWTTESTLPVFPAWSNPHDIPLSVLLNQLQQATSVRIRETLEQWLTVAVSSLDALVDFVTTLQQAVLPPNASTSAGNNTTSTNTATGKVDPTSLSGLFVRSSCGIGFDRLSLEAKGLLRHECAAQLAWARLESNDNNNNNNTDSAETPQELPPSALRGWFWSSGQLEARLERHCARQSLWLNNNNNNNNNNNEEEESAAEVERGLDRLTALYPDVPATHFLRFLHCVETQERVGAIDALHAYFDYILIRRQRQRGSSTTNNNNNNTNNTTGSDNSTNNNNPNNNAAASHHHHHRFQFAAILLAALHHSTGDAALSRLATEEAIRVAQQSKDAGCVAFALGWLYENSLASSSGSGGGGGVADQAQELLTRCMERAHQVGTTENIRSLVAGAHFSYVRHTLTRGRGSTSGAQGGGGGGNGDAFQTARAHWAASTTDAPASDTTVTAATLSSSSSASGLSTSLGLSSLNLSTQHQRQLDRRTTHMGQIPDSGQALRILGQQRLVAAAIWDAFNQSASSGFASMVALYFHAEQLLPLQVVAAIQNIARTALYGVTQEVLAPENLTTTTTTLEEFSRQKNSLFGGEESKEDDNATLSYYGTALQRLIRLRRAFCVPVKAPFSQEVLLILHEWAIRRGEIHHAEHLLRQLLGNLYPGMANYVSVQVDVRIQQSLLFAARGNWQAALTTLKDQLLVCQREGFHSQRALVLLRLALIYDESGLETSTCAIPHLLECVALCDEYQMDGLHAMALSGLARAHLRLLKINEAIAMVHAALPTLLQKGHVWFQADAYLTLAQCHMSHLNGKDEASLKQKAVKQTLRLTLAALQNSERLFRLCQDGKKLREIYYLTALVANKLPRKTNLRDTASERFLKVSQFLSRALVPAADGFMDRVHDDEELEKLARRSYVEGY